MRVTCISPSSVMPTTTVLMRSFATAFFSRCVTSFCAAVSAISIKSMMIIPERFLRRICFAASSAASRFVFRIVFCKSPLPAAFPVFTSITTQASVSSITRKPPLFSQTCSSSAFSLWLSRKYASNSGIASVCSLRAGCPLPLKSPLSSSSR